MHVQRRKEGLRLRTMVFDAIFEDARQAFSQLRDRETELRQQLGRRAEEVAQEPLSIADALQIAPGALLCIVVTSNCCASQVHCVQRHSGCDGLAQPHIPVISVYYIEVLSPVTNLSVSQSRFYELTSVEHSLY